MGTSSDYGGKKSNLNKLLPKGWLDDDIAKQITGKKVDLTSKSALEDIQKKIASNIRRAHITNTKFFSNNKKARDVVKRNIEANGYSKGLSKRIIMSAGSPIVSFANVLKSFDGINNREYLEKLGVDYENKSPLIVMTEIANKIAPDGSDKDDTVAIISMLKVIEHLFDGSEEDIENFSLDASKFNDLMIMYINEIVLNIIITDMGKEITKNTKDAEDFLKKEDELRDYIYTYSNSNTCKIDFSDNDFTKLDIDEFIKDAADYVVELLYLGDDDE
jgi:hypothetical protein